jgi:hypothetical protein|tara:strand:- start:551 stop:718 length:168 start_codon:yes stop_codon:yes gene_type:complete
MSNGAVSAVFFPFDPLRDKLNDRSPGLQSGQSAAIGSRFFKAKAADGLIKNQRMP